jgi:hypothetical protein
MIVFPRRRHARTGTASLPHLQANQSHGRRRRSGAGCIRRGRSPGLLPTSNSEPPETNSGGIASGRRAAPPCRASSSSPAAGAGGLGGTGAPRVLGACLLLDLGRSERGGRPRGADADDHGGAGAGAEEAVPGVERKQCKSCVLPLCFPKNFLQIPANSQAAFSFWFSSRHE